MRNALGILLIASAIGLSFLTPSAWANVYFSWSGDDGECGQDLPYPPFKPWDFRKDATAQTICELDGSRYFQWRVADNQHDAYNQIFPGNFPVQIVAGKTYYLAFRVNFTRQNGKDIWCNTPDQRAGECFDKFIEIVGSRDRRDLRWIVHFGEKGMQTRHERFSTFMATYSDGSFNPEVEVWGIYYQNCNGYDRENAKLLQYETWYNVVMAVKMAADKTGSIALYIDGEKIIDYRNIKTMQPDSSINFIGMNGTFAQPGYAINAHTRKAGNLLLTDNWREIAARGYLGPPGNPAREDFPPTVVLPNPEQSGN